MPRVLQPGGGGGKMRVRYTARRKRGLVATSKRMIAEGMTLRAAAEELRGCERGCVEELCWLFFVPCEQSAPMCVLVRTPEQ